MKGRKFAITVIVAGMFCAAANAGSIVNIGNYMAFETDITFTMAYQGIGKARTVNYTYSQQLFPGFPGQSVSGSTQAGELIYNIDGQNEIVWSVDINQSAASGSQTYNAALLIDANYMLSLDKLYYQYGQYVAANQNSLVALTDAAAGFQLAIWELTYETMGFNLLSGSFSVNSSTAATLATDWLTNMDNITAPGLQRKILVNPSSQDVIHYQTVSVVPSVPEPLTMISISLAGIATGGYVLRRLRSKPKSC